MKTTRIAIALALAFSLSACADAGPKQTAGTLLGAALGGLAGSQIGKGSGKSAAVGAGVLLGGLLGSEAGKSLDKADRLYAQQTAKSSLERAPGILVYHVPRSRRYEPAPWDYPAVPGFEFCTGDCQ